MRVHRSQGTGMQIVELSVPGAHCGACRAVILRHLRATPGVRSAELDLRDRRATVLVNPAAVDTSDLCQRLGDAGYPAAPVGASAPAEHADDTPLD